MQCEGHPASKYLRGNPGRQMNYCIVELLTTCVYMHLYDVNCVYATLVMDAVFGCVFSACYMLHALAMMSCLRDDLIVVVFRFCFVRFSLFMKCQKSGCPDFLLFLKLKIGTIPINSGLLAGMD